MRIVCLQLAEPPDEMPLGGGESMGVSKNIVRLVVHIKDDMATRGLQAA